MIMMAYKMLKLSEFLVLISCYLKAWREIHLCISRFIKICKLKASAKINIRVLAAFSFVSKYPKYTDTFYLVIWLIKFDVFL